MQRKRRVGRPRNMPPSAPPSRTIERDVRPLDSLDAAFGIYTDTEIQLLINSHANIIGGLALSLGDMTIEAHNQIMREAERILFLCKSMQLTTKRTRS